MFLHVPTIQPSEPSPILNWRLYIPQQTLSTKVYFGRRPKTEYDPHVTQESGGMVVVFNLALFSCLKYEIYIPEAA